MAVHGGESSVVPVELFVFVCACVFTPAVWNVWHHLPSAVLLLWIILSHCWWWCVLWIFCWWCVSVTNKLQSMSDASQGKPTPLSLFKEPLDGTNTLIGDINAGSSDGNFIWHISLKGNLITTAINKLYKKAEIITSDQNCQSKYLWCQKAST